MVTILLVFLFFVTVELLRFYFKIRKNKQLEVLLTQRQKEFRYLSFFTKDVLITDEPIQKSFPRYLNTLKENLNWDFHSIFRLDEDRQVVIARFTGYLPDWYMEELSTKIFVRVGDASVGRAVATKQPVTINVATQDPRFKNVQSFPGRTGYKSLSCYPLIGRLRTHGGFCVYSAFENIFTLHDTEFFLTLANLFGAFLESQLINEYATKSSGGVQMKKED